MKHNTITPNPTIHHAGSRVWRPFRHGALALVAGLACGAVVPRSFGGDQPYHFQAVRYLGDPAPGGGTFVNDFEPTALNNRGQLAFTADLSAPEGEGIFLASGGTVQQIVRVGQAAPGGGTFSAVELGQVGLNDAGEVAFAFSLEPLDFGPPVNAAIYRWSPRTQGLTPVVLPNVTPDPSGGVFVGADFSVSLNNQGALVFTGYVTNSPVGLGRGAFLQDKSGHITSVARPGDAAPEGGTFIRAMGSLINDTGDIAFVAKTLNIPHYFQTYVRSFSTGLLELIPQPAPVIGANVWGFNSRGATVIGGVYAAGAGIGAVYVSDGGSTTLVAAVGNPAPGGGNFSFITAANVATANAALNNLGNVVFDAATDTGDEALYFYSSATKTLRRLAGIGTAIPGVGTIVSLEQVGTIYPPPTVTGFPVSYLALNDRDQVAFAATVVSGTATRGVLLLATPVGQ